MTLWAWESEAQDAAGCGISDDRQRALRAAAEWMRGHGAERAVAEEVRLAWERVIIPFYVPIGSQQPLEARRDASGRVRWHARQTVAA